MLKNFGCDFYFVEKAQLRQKLLHEAVEKILEKIVHIQN